MFVFLQVLHQSNQVLLASSTMALCDDGTARPSICKQWYALTPSGDPSGPAFLLHHLACREQLQLVKARPAAGALQDLEPSPQQLQLAEHLVSQLSVKPSGAADLEPQNDMPLALTISSGCHAALGSLLRAAQKTAPAAPAHAATPHAGTAAGAGAGPAVVASRVGPPQAAAAATTPAQGAAGAGRPVVTMPAMTMGGGGRVTGQGKKGGHRPQLQLDMPRTGRH